MNAAAATPARFVRRARDADFLVEHFFGQAERGEILPARSRDVARKIFAAVTIGDVTALDSLTSELTAGSPQEAVLGQRLTRLVSAFDFDGLRQVAIALTRNEGAGDGQ